MKHKLRWELAAALMLKLVLLVGLWYIVFRPDGHVAPPQAPIAEHFMLPTDSKIREFVHERR